MQSKEIDVDEAREYTLGAVLEAGYMLRDHFKKVGGRTLRRGAVTLTMEADEAADIFLKSRLKKKYPESQFLSEETAAHGYSKLVDSDYLWIVDSLDGRINFSRGHENFAISVALVKDKMTQLGVIYAPIRGDSYWATVESEGVFLNNNVVSVSEINQFKNSLIALDWPYNLRQRETVLRWASAFAPRVRQIKSTGSAVLDLALVAAGKIDAYVQLGTKPWDTAAGALLVEKAKGRVTTPEGENWDPFNHRILATNSILHDPILDLIGGCEEPD